MQPRLSVVTSLYKGAEYLAPFLKNLAEQSLFAELELVLVHNEPSPDELDILKEFNQTHPKKIQHIVVDEVEALGASWNRGWRAAKGEYVAIWNVDDRRTPDSLEQQLALMEQHSEAAVCYGDLYEVPEYGLEDGAFVSTPPYSLKRFRRSFPQRGAFLVFRKSIADTLGYFDEQLQVGPDLDYAWRIAARGGRMIRAEGVMGYFTNAEQGLSTRDGARRSAVERTVLQLRYGVFDKVRSEYLAEAKQYRLGSVLNSGEWVTVSDLLPGYRNYVALRRPLRLLGWLRNILRSIFRRLGILRAIYALQERYIQREI